MMILNRTNRDKKSGTLSEKSGVHILRKVPKYIEKVHGEYNQNT